MAARSKVSKGRRNDRDDVAAAALGLFAERGYQSTGIRDLADALGIGPTSIYSHIGSKGELLNAILRETLEGLLSAQADAIASTADPTEQLRRVAEAQVRFYLDHPQKALVTTQDFSHAAKPERDSILAARLTYRNTLAELIENGRKAGAFDVGSPKIAAIAIIEMCEAVPRWYRPAGELSRTSIEYMYGEFAVRLAGGR